MLPAVPVLLLLSDSVAQFAQGGQPPLYQIMACMRDIRKCAERTEASFTPLRDTVRLFLGS